MHSRRNLRVLPNPYDFSHPVRDRSVFSGRGDLIEEIRYYLDHASLDARPMNLAILGPRASGKTSLLNMIELEARERGYCVSRVNLNEGDIDSGIVFFFKIFDAVFNAACEVRLDDGSEDPQYAFGGRDGTTYEAYVDMTTTYLIPENRKWRPFSFPVIYAKAMNGQNYNVRVSEPQLTRDLTLIHEEVQTPIVILMDEGNVLAESRPLLQQVRNIFMNTPGYMIVMSGTLDMFPVMDAVFSPVSRDFKRFVIGRFGSEAEAEECVLKPLLSIGVNDPELLFDDETLSDLVDQQGLAAGSPYQIQLICHYLFRDLQQGGAD